MQRPFLVAAVGAFCAVVVDAVDAISGDDMMHACRGTRRTGIKGAKVWTAVNSV